MMIGGSGRHTTASYENRSTFIPALPGKVQVPESDMQALKNKSSYCEVSCLP